MDTPLESIPMYFNMIHESNLSQSLKDSSDEFDSEPAPAVKVHASSIGRVFSVNSIQPVSAYNGRIPIVTPSGYQVVQVIVRSVHYGYLQHNRDFQTYTLPHNGLHYIKVNKKTVTFEGPYTYWAYYRKLAPAVSPQEVFNLDKTALLSVLHEMRAAGFLALADALSRHIDGNKQVDVEGLTEVFANTGFYTYAPEKPSRGIPQANEFSEFARYLRSDHELYYQCTASNMIHQLFFKKYFARAQGLSDEARASIVVEGISGYVRRPEELVITAATGHYHGSIGKLGGLRSYIETDAKPVTPDKPHAPPTLVEGSMYALRRHNPWMVTRRLIRESNPLQTRNEAALLVHKSAIATLESRRQAVYQMLEKEVGSSLGLGQLTGAPGLKSLDREK